MTDLGVAILCAVIFLLILALCAVAHLLDVNAALERRLKELEK